MQLTIDIVNDYMIVKLRGELDHHTSEYARKKIDQRYYSNNSANIVLDLRELNFMDSAGIGLIMGRYKNCIDRNGKVSIVSTSPYINRMLKMSGIQKLVDIYQTIEEAIKG
ncbi:MAG TPA: anti-sigma factor antagonist [Tissierellia bacterium]|nr:anti-sigma factor antagonist [Tissierellia bacterium]